MKVTFGTFSVSPETKTRVAKILDSGRVSSGRTVREFEESFARWVGVKEAVAVSTGTDADALALSILYDFGAQRGDEIIIPALSFVATGNAVLQAGFKPVFVDIERRTLNINSRLIERAVTKRTKAIMPVHLMGKPAPMDEIKAIARRYKLYVFEDAAEAHGAKYKNKNVGTLGDAGAFSLYLAHIITTVEGGIVTTNRTDFAEILRSLRSHGRACVCRTCILNTKSGYCHKRFQKEQGIDIRFRFDRIGYSSKMNELEAAIGLGSLALQEQIIAKRRENLLYLMKSFKKFSPALSTIAEERIEKIGPHAFPIIVPERSSFTRSELSNYLEKHGIETRYLFTSIPTQSAGFSFLGHRLGDFPEAEFIGTHGLHIGVHQDLKRSHLDYVNRTVDRFLREHASIST